MKISVTGRHIQIRGSVKDYVTKKTARLERFFDQLQHAEVVITRDGETKRVEMIMTARVGGRFVGEVRHEDTLVAVDLLVDKMEQQLRRKKEKLKQRTHERPDLTPPTELESETEDEDVFEDEYEEAPVD